MIIIFALFFGAGFGALRARAQKGNRLDMAQYAAIYAMIFAVLALFLTIALARMQ